MRIVISSLLAIPGHEKARDLFCIHSSTGILYTCLVLHDQAPGLNGIMSWQGKSDEQLESSATIIVISLVMILIFSLIKLIEWIIMILK